MYNDFSVNITSLTQGSCVRKSGASGNSGLSASPKDTIANGLAVGSSNTILYLLDGEYRTGTINNSTRDIVGDGNVSIIANTAQSDTFTLSRNVDNVTSKFTVRDFATVSGSGINVFSLLYVKNIGQCNVFLIGCTINNSLLSSTHGAIAFIIYNSVFINQRSSQTASNVKKIYITDSYIDNTFIVNCSGGSTLGSCVTYFLRCDFQGIMNYGANGYVVPQSVDLTGGGTGVVSFASRTGSYPAGATDWMHNGLGISATTCYITNGNFNADPLFNNVQNEDFTVAVNSPLINKAQTDGYSFLNVNIGNVKVASNTSAVSAWTLSNISVNADSSYTITSGNSGTLTSPTFTLDPTRTNKKAVGLLNYVGGLWHDVSSSGGTSYVNENVPRVPSYVKLGSTITNNSPRISVEMRMSTKSTTPSPSTDSDWDNNSYSGINTGEWFIIDPFQIPKIDAVGYGNADSLHDLSTTFTPIAYDFQIRITLLNNNTQG